MALSNRIAWRLVAGAGAVVLVGCGGHSTSNGSATPAPAAWLGFSLQPLDQTVLAGKSVTFTVAALGTGTLAYQWQLNGAALAGATSATLTLTNVQAAQMGAYACVVTDASGAKATSSFASLVVNAPPVIAAQPATAPVGVLGGSISFSVAAAGDGSLTYQWLKNGVALANSPAAAPMATLARADVAAAATATIAGATSATLTLSNLGMADAGTYTCAVTANLNGTAVTTLSAPSVLGVATAPAIGTQPAAAQTAALGMPATFTVAATGPDTLTYQWQKDGTALSGATDATLTLAAVQATDAGAYACVVTDTSAAGLAASVTSTPETLLVNLPPAVQGPATVIGGLNGSVTLSVTALGSGALSYQWAKGAAPIAGATGATLVLTGIQATDAATYTCAVTNTLNGTATVTAYSEALTVQAGPSIVPPAATTAAQAGAATFSVTATGPGTLSYQWTKNGAPIAGATSATLTLANVQPADGAAYACIVTETVSGVASSSTSATATLTVNQTPVFTTSPAATQNLVLGSGATFTAAATSDGAITYQWTKGGVNIAGATAGTYTIAATAATDAATYACVATSTLNGTTATATSAASALVLNAPPVIATQPVATQTVLLGAAASFSIVATPPATGTLSYQWTKGGTNISGATAATYAIAATAKTDAGTYACKVTSTLGTTTATTTSANSVLAENWAPTILNPPAASITGSQGTSQGFAAAYPNPLITLSTGLQPAGAVVTYQWYRNGAPVVAGATGNGSTYTIASSNSNINLTIGTLQVADAGSYYFTATNTLNGVVASTSTTPSVLSVCSLPVIRQQPYSQNVNQGGAPPIFSVQASGNGTLGYQWYTGAVPTSALSSYSFPLAGATPLVGQTGATCILQNAHVANNGNYFCIVTNTLNGVTNYQYSTAAVLTVAPLAVTPVVSMDPFFTANQVMEVSTQDQGNVTYAWTVPGATIIGSATGRTLTFTAPASGTVTATVVVSDAATNSTATGSATASIKSFVAPDLVTPLVVHPGDNWMRAFTTARTGETYLWSVTNGTASGAIVGSTSGTTANFSVTSGSANGSVLTLKANAQNTADSTNATATATINVKTGVWVTKDGSAVAAYGAYPTATTLASGQVLIAGGASSNTTLSATTMVFNTASIYDPATGRTVATAPMNVPRSQHTATLLPNGSVLVAGGWNVTNGAVTYLQSAELWDPETGSWTLLPSLMQSARFFHCAVLQADGRVALLGGRSVNSPATYPAMIELFDPTTNTFAQSGTPTLALPRYQAAVVALGGADAGKFLLTGGVGPTTGGSGNTWNPEYQNELYNPVAGTSTKTANLNIALRYAHTATLLADGTGRILLVGGSGSAATAELITPTGTAPNFSYQGATQATTGTLTHAPAGGPLTVTAGRALQTANLLPDGTVLLAGGSLNTAGESFSYEIYNPATNTFTNGYSTVNPPSMLLNGGHYAHVSAQLTSGQVVIVGGMGNTSYTSLSSTVELFTVGATPGAPGTVTVPAGQTLGRVYHTATRLADGRVLVAGGASSLNGTGGTPSYNYTYPNTVSIYDPTLNAWTSTGNLNAGRYAAQAILLATGDVLITGGRTYANSSGSSTAEVWNHTTGVWTTVGPMTSSRVFHSLVLLKDGTVLVIGGQATSSGNPTNTCELFNPTTQTFTAVGGLTEAKAYLSPVLLASGKVAVAGGYCISADGSSLVGTNVVEVYDPVAQTWTAMANHLANARQLHTTTLMPNGQLLLIGGLVNTTTDNTAPAGWDTANFVPVAGSATEVFDFNLNGGAGGSLPSTATFTYEGRSGHNAALLTSGKVLIVGGKGSLNATNGTPIVELYDPTTGTFTATDPLLVPFSANTWAFTTTLLSNGDVLNLGGPFTDTSSRIYR